MLSRYIRFAALAVSTLGVSAQKSVPADLSTAFTGDPELQVSFTGNAVEGFRDGTAFSQADVSKEPTFALGDASGISPTAIYTILMLDTTSDSRRVLHYARANFKVTGDIVNLGTDDAPLLEYKAPGTLGEKGGEAKYTFLLYFNTNRKRIESLKLPAEGEAFDVKTFESENNLQPPDAGLGMVVKLGEGGAGGETSSASASPSSSASASATTSSSSTAAASSSVVLSTPAPATSSATSASSVQSNTPRPTSAATSAATSAETPAPSSTSPAASSPRPSVSSTSGEQTSEAATPSASAAVPTTLQTSEVLEATPTTQDTTEPTPSGSPAAEASGLAALGKTPGLGSAAAAAALAVVVALAG